MSTFIRDNTCCTLKLLPIKWSSLSTLYLNLAVLGRPRPSPRPGRLRPSAFHENRKFAVIGRPRPLSSPEIPRPADP